MNTAILTMAAIALALGVNGETDIWGFPEEAPEADFVAMATVEVAPEVAEEACLIIEVIHNGSDRFTGETVLTGGLEVGEIRTSIVGHFLWVAIGYPADTDTRDMDVKSIDVSDVESVTICLPS